MPNQALKDEHNILRHVASGRLRRDEEGVVIGCLPQAFEHREDEDYLSATWIEHFTAAPVAQRELAIKAMRNALKIGRNAAFFEGNVKAIHDACRERTARIRILHEPTDENPGHAALRRVPRDDAELRGLLADKVFTTFILNGAVA